MRWSTTKPALRRPGVIAVAFALAAPASARPAGDDDGSLLPGPAPRPRPAYVDGVGAPSDRRCAECHQEIAAEWRGSLHHHAWENDYFQRSYAREGGAFCRACHAPYADPSAPPTAAEQEAGIGCGTCHVAASGIVGTRPIAMRDGAHAVVGDGRLATAAACGRCHAFAFPAAPGERRVPMQDTLAEHARSTAAATPCQGCHMPRVASRAGGTHASHAFTVQGDAHMLAQAVTVDAATLGVGEVHLAVSPGAIGHAFPTGDLLRRVEVRAAPIDAAGRALAAPSVVVLERTFGTERSGRDGFARVERSDTRLVAPRALALPVPRWARRARWQIVWQRLPPSLALKLGMAMRDQELVIQEGIVTR